MDKNTPNVVNPITEGDVMRDHAMTIKLRNSESTEQVELYGVDITLTTSELTNR